MSLATLARDEVVTASPDASGTELARQMRDETVGCVVITEDDRPVGLVTDRDLTIRLVADGHDPATTTARDVMTEHPTTVDVGTGLYELTEVMEDNAVRRMPVVDGDRLAGIITLDDVQGLLVDELDNLSDVIEEESPDY
ncbi:CBS domain-containing protein [Halomarina rubra]|uniref:CBS domain-containing protein n=1 Tax=Halomarina rubra TaxID=2071873 RepID=A0ABD6AUD0_9EURY|nr:CBS domain-containing protein [Halomarina rubra]